MIANRTRINQLSSIVIFVAALIVLSSNMTSRLYMSDIEDWDAEHYYTMAETTELTEVEAPFAYRWLPHKLVAFVPLPAKRVYELFTWMFLLIGSILWLRVLEAIGLDRARATIVVVLVFLWGHWGGHFYIWYRAGTEPLAYLLLGAGFLATERRSLLGLIVVGVIGAMCREHTLLLFPYFFLRHAFNGNFIRTTAEVAISAIPAFAVYFWVHAVTPVTETFNLMGVSQTGSHSLLAASQYWITTKFSSFEGLLKITASLLTHTGFLVPLLFLFPESRRAILRPHLLFWISSCVVVGIVAGNDTDRLMYYAFGGEMIAFCLALKAIPSPETSRQWVFWGTVMLAQIVLSQTFANELYPANVRPIWHLQNVVIWTVVVGIVLRWARQDPDRSAKTIKS